MSINHDGLITDTFNCAELEEIIRLANKQAFKLNQPASSTEFLAAHKVVKDSRKQSSNYWKKVKEEGPMVSTLIQTGCTIIQTICAIIQIIDQRTKNPNKPSGKPAGSN